MYKGLVLFGTDFESIANMISNKNRNQIINKFHREEKRNPEKIEKALRKHLNGEKIMIGKFKDFFPQETLNF